MTKRTSGLRIRLRSPWSRGDEIRVHGRELLARPRADLLQIFAGARRSAHKRVLAAEEVFRRLSDAPPLFVVGHEYAGKVRLASRRTLRHVDRQINNRLRI